GEDAGCGGDGDDDGVVGIGGWCRDGVRCGGERLQGWPAMVV
ncbi:hypothetical protein Tco_0753145, partial [Tanacetum coccineum]